MLDNDRALSDLTAGARTVADLMAQTHNLPERLAGSQLLHTPKAGTRTTLEDLNSRRRMHTRVVTPADLGDLPTAWRQASEAAGAAANHLQTALQRQPRAADRTLSGIDHTI